MIRAVTSCALTAGLIGATAIGFSGSAQSTEDVENIEPMPLVCDTNLVAGLYGVNAMGLVGMHGNVGGQHYSAVGVIELRVDGSISVRLRQVIGGEPIDMFENEGFYIVNGDCTGTAEFGESSWEFVAVGNATEIYWIGTAPGWVVEADSHRIFVR